MLRRSVRFLPIMLLLLVGLLLTLPLIAHAQDTTPESTPVVTVTPAPTPAPDTHSSDVSAIIEALKEFALILAVVVLAFKTGSLIPPDTVDGVLARGFDLANGLADKTPTPVDNQFLEIAKPIVLKWVQDELTKKITQQQQEQADLILKHFPDVPTTPAT